MEWKFLPINFLDIPVLNNQDPVNLSRANILSSFTLPEILALKFTLWDKQHKGTIREWVVSNVAPQLRSYIKSPQVVQRVECRGLEMRACLVIIVGSRQIILWDMDKEGNLAEVPLLVG